MYSNVHLTKSVGGQEVVEEGNYAVGPLANIHALINEVVDLLLKVCILTLSNAGNIQEHD